MFCICELANNQRKFSVSGTDNNVCLVFLRHPVIKKKSTAVSEAVNSEILGVFLSMFSISELVPHTETELLCS